MANPPITIGPFNNVPAPGSPIRSDWTQQITHFVWDAPGVVRKSGDTMAGNLNVGAVPTASTPGASVDTRGFLTVVPQAALDGTPNIRCDRITAPSTNAGQPYAQFVRAGTAIGSITIASATTVAFNTTSDPRLKQPTGDAADAADLVARLGARAYRARWIDPATGDAESGGQEWVVLSSHDIQDVAPFAVTGERDALDGDGNVIPQQVNYPALVPLLTAALAQALDRITALEART